MEQMELISRQQPGLIAIDNFEEMKAALAAILARYENVVYTEAMLADAKADKKELTRLRKDIDDRRKEIKKLYLEPYQQFEGQIKDLLAMIDGPLDAIKEFVSGMEDREKEAKREEIQAYFMQHSAPLGDMARQVWDSPAFFDKKWLNKTTAAKTWKPAVDAKIAAAARDLNAIRSTGGPHTGALTVKYLETLEAGDLSDWQARLQAADRAGEGPAECPSGEGQDMECQIWKVTGTRQQMDRARELLALAGVRWEVLEHGASRPAEEDR